MTGIDCSIVESEFRADLDSFGLDSLNKAYEYVQKHVESSLEGPIDMLAKWGWLGGYKLLMHQHWAKWKIGLTNHTGHVCCFPLSSVISKWRWCEEGGGVEGGQHCVCRWWLSVGGCCDSWPTSIYHTNIPKIHQVLVLVMVSIESGETKKVYKWSWRQRSRITKLVKLIFHVVES